MMFIELNDGRKQNTTHISSIELDGTDILYKAARGSLDAYTEHFETEQEAKSRYDELKDMLLV